MKTPGIGRRLERQGREGVGAPAKATDDMAECAHGLERGVEYGATAGVVDKIEALLGGMGGDIGLDAFVFEVDGRGAKCR